MRPIAQKHLVFAADGKIDDFAPKGRMPYGSSEWKEFISKNTLSEAFMRKHADKFDFFVWAQIAWFQRHLSDDFIRDFHQDLKLENWTLQNQQLSENLMEELQDKINWLDAFATQKMSNTFKKKMFHKYETAANIIINREIDDDEYKAQMEKFRQGVLDKYEKLKKSLGL